MEDSFQPGDEVYLISDRSIKMVVIEVKEEVLCMYRDPKTSDVRRDFFPPVALKKVTNPPLFRVIGRKP